MIKVKKFFGNKYLWILIFTLGVGMPLLIASKNVFQGSIPFWYDPARDFLQALESFHKPTLHGPPSGIPGIFYGPQWIWLLSLGLIFSHDPRIVVYIIQTIPYLVVVPIFLFSLKSLADKKILIFVWILFALNFGQTYATFPWNPHIAPLLFFILLFLLLRIEEKSFSKKDFVLVGIVGFIVGNLLNVHISFGIGVTVGTIVYLLIDSIIAIKSKRSSLKERTIFLTLFAFGFAITLFPFLLFEIRHGFSQSQALINTLTAGKSVVTVTGLTKSEVIGGFFGTVLTLYKLPLNIFLVLMIIPIVEIILLAQKRKLNLTIADRRVGLFILSVAISILGIYLLTKNPVWGYHFIGIELLFMFASILILKKTRFSIIIVGLWSLIILGMYISIFVKSLSFNPLTLPNLVSKEYVVKLIDNDAGEKPYAVFAYSPSIYIYEYAYLFPEMVGKELSFDPGSERSYEKLVYLIVPEGDPGKIADFINFRTPEREYGTTKSWSILDGTKILRRELLPVNTKVK